MQGTGCRGLAYRGFVYFLQISQGSASELETQVLISKEIYPKVDFRIVDELLVEIQKMLHAIIAKLVN